ncbi:MAG: 4Fe-4S binding protein [Thermoplasmata archaeon]|nr:MAG: 4Fe-4S binding protein [Thermoplasmata archaeon]
MAETDVTGKKVPKIDYNKCTGKGICMEVCPEDIFEIRNLSQIEYCEDVKTSGICPDPEYAAKEKRSYPVNINNCTACGLCVDECPEKAIVLIDSDCIE